MAQSGYTPIQLYRSSTSTNTPSAGNLADGELAINTADGKLFYKDSGGNVQVLATKGTGAIGGSNTQIQFNNGGALGGSANLTWDGTNFVVGSSKVTIVASSGNTSIAGTLGVTSDFAINTNKFTVAAASGNTSVAGTLGVTGATTLNGQTLVSYSGALAIVRDTQAYSDGVNGGTINLQGLNSSSTNANLAVLQALATTAENGKLRIKVGNSGSVSTVADFTVSGLAVTGNTTTTGYFGIGTSGYISQSGSAGDVLIDNPTSGKSIKLRNTASGGTLEFDGSGNLGLGVTPSAWSTSFSCKAFQFSDKSALSADTNTLSLSQNACQSSAGTWKYLASSVYALRYDQNNASGEHVWWRAGTGTAGNAITFTQAMTLDSSGNLLVGETSDSTTTRLGLKGATSDSSAYAAVVRDSSDVAIFTIRNDGRVLTGASTLSPYNNTTGSAANVYVDSNGILYRSTSSLRYKRDVQDAIHGLSEVLALRPVTYKGKGESDADRVFGGLIAEEVHAAGLTEFVQYDSDGNPDALAYGNMVSLLTKAIQELSAKNDALEARLAALEAA